MEPFLTQPNAPTTRRGFFKRASLGVGVLASASALQACDSDDNSSGADVTLNFSSDTGVLNYAYALEQLEAAFYARVVALPNFATLFSGTALSAGGQSEQAILRDLAAHEAIHAQFLARALGNDAIPALTVDFSSVDFASRTAILTAARTFEDLGVAAYNGAGKYLTSVDNLVLAGKIVSVEARHAAAIRDLFDPFSRLSVDSRDPARPSFDTGLEPSAVLAAADPFITETIAVTGIPTVAN
ncbi:MAG TPA: ferritin-like domain-containing protein [Rubricoccaceae bacterium]|jgi:hypothetical protein